MKEVLEKVKEKLMEKLEQEKDLPLEELQKILEMVLRLEEFKLCQIRADMDLEMIKQRSR